MNVYCDPDAVIKESGEKTDLVIGVPGGLGSAMFPMDFQIEAAKLSLTPYNDQLPVETGTSIIPEREDKASGGVFERGIPVCQMPFHDQQGGKCNRHICGQQVF